MKIAVIGQGRVGSALGEQWITKGHKVVYGSRSKDNHDGKSVFSQKEAIEQSDVIVLAIPGTAMKDTVTHLKLKDKIVIDTTNSPNSGMEDVMPFAPLAKWVKAFNTIGYNIMVNPDFGGNRADGYYCADDDLAGDIAKQLIKDIGMHPVKVGNTTMVKDLECLAWLWIKMARTSGNREFAFKLLSR